MRRLSVPVVMSIVSVLLSGCIGQAEPTEEPLPAHQVRVFGNYRGRQATAFRLVLDEFTARTGIEVSYVGTADFAGRITQRVRDGDPPDVALFPQPAILADLARQGFVQPLDDDAAASVTANYPDDLLDVMRVDGVLHGVWYRASVKSLVWYPPQQFKELGYSVPGTWGSLLALTKRMAGDGQTPWCLGMESFGATGWVGTDWIEDLVLRLDGPDFFDRWTQGHIPFTDPGIREAFEQFGNIALDPDSVAGGRRAVLSAPATRAIDPMLEDPPGCLLSRQGSFQILDLPESVTVGHDQDLDFFVLPPTEAGEAPVLAAGEIAATLTGTREAQRLLTFLATPAAAEPWASVTGFVTPQKLDPDLYASEFDRRISELLASADVIRFDGSDLMPPSVGSGTFWDGMVDYVAGLDLDEVLAEIQRGYERQAAGGPQ